MRGNAFLSIPSTTKYRSNTVSAIVKEVGEVLQNVPYVKGLSGIVLQSIKIREEFKSNKKRCREIIDKVLRITKSIYERLEEVSKSNGLENLTRLKNHLEECESTLTAVYNALEKYRSRRSIAKFINRGLDDLNELDHRVDELNIKLIVDILVDIKLEQATTEAANKTMLSESMSTLTRSAEHVLPPKPHFIIQRDKQIDCMLTILLSKESSRIIILGGGGFGKTTLACFILHNPLIEKRFGRRYFLSCESMMNADSLLYGLGNMLSINAAPSNILAFTRRILSNGPSVLCLDNFETPWEPSSTRTEVEELLAADIHRPLRILRSVALLSAESRIRILSPVRLFCWKFFPSEISERLANLIQYYIDFLSLSGSILCNPAQIACIIPEINNIHSIFQRGYTSSTVQDMTKLVEATCSLSNWSRYIGYTGRDALQLALAKSAHLLNLHAECLIAFGELYRWDRSLDAAEKCYREALYLFSQGKNIIGEALALKSIGSVLLKMRKSDQAENTLGKSLESYVHTNDCVGEANVRKNLGRLYLAKNMYSEAEERFNSTLEIYKHIPDLLGQANTYGNMADLHIKPNNLDKAEEFAALALDVSRRANFAIGEGNALDKLGYVYLRTDSILKGQQTLQQSLSLFRQIKAPMSELNAANLLAHIYIQQHQLSAAEECLIAATKVALDVIQIPTALTTLGWVYIRGNQWAKAEVVIQEAETLYRKVNDRIWGQAEVCVLKVELTNPC
ncbi:TPR-like protein [Pholiota conissans]|uniref:TPR-like protein n=1 Tax=Pholiota conissans TaxID=109636 RepID=A0A9P5YNS8_9AGAR|nr:TPR-like protein [Pholiota conissans]